jgi:hypothetical protein
VGYKKSHTRNDKDTSRILDDRSSPPSALQLPGASGRASDDVSQKHQRVVNDRQGLLRELNPA